MGFWSLLNDFWSPLEDMVDECARRREADLLRDIRRQREDQARKQREKDESNRRST